MTKVDFEEIDFVKLIFTINELGVK